MDQTHFDVLIVGAGLSGIGAAHHLQTSCPRKTFAILEARDRLGGTWDLFRYPGVRSDSDMYTLGYTFRPWTSPKSIADGPSILAYVRETAEASGIDKKIRYGRRVVAARWSSGSARWTLDVEDVATGETSEFTCGFLFACSGYYDYDAGYTPDFAGRDVFRGRIVHPQKWTPDIEYDGKRVVVIGSGATAVTLVPEMAKRAAHVTMLQRSPTYVVSVPERDPVAHWAQERFSESRAHAMAKWFLVLRGMGFYAYCKRFPEHSKKFLVGMVEKALGGEVDVGAHFTPSYKPWDQRLCFVPDGDLFETLRSGRASVVTDHVDRFVENGILLRSGKTLEADVVVTATGLKLKLFGGIRLDVDGRRVEPAKTLAYKGMMCSDVPNLAFAVGYTNASWTLKCDLTAAFVCRLLNYMSKRGYTMCCPRRRDAGMKEEPILDFSSGYVQRSLHELPRQGTFAPWRLYNNYALDLVSLRHSRLADRYLEFGSPDRSPAQRPSER